MLVINDAPASIGTYAFSECTNLESVTLGTRITEIKASAFSQCKNIASITIPNSTTTIGQRAFQDCSGMTELTIGKRVKSIGMYAFGYCTGLETITSKIRLAGYGEVDLGSQVFEEVPTSTCVLKVPKGTVYIYSRADQWSDFLNIVEDSDSSPQGDVNGDGTVNGEDINDLINEVLGKGNAGDDADVDGDGEVNGNDINQVINIVLGH